MHRAFILFSFFLPSTCLPGQYGPLLEPADYFAPEEIARASTAKDLNYLYEEEKNIFLYTNLARTCPRKFYKLYESYVMLKYGEPKLTSNRYYTTLTETLKEMKAVDVLSPDTRMYKLAECWAIESGEKGVIGHDRKLCEAGYAGENCAYGYHTGLDNVMALLIDEGIKNLGHRKNMLREDYKGLGVAIRKHKSYRFCAVQDFAFTNDKLRRRDSIRRVEEIEIIKDQALRREERTNEFHVLMGKWTEEERARADASRSLKYLNTFEKDIYFYINLMRLYPKKFKSLIWDNGPFFDQVPEDQVDVHQNDKYKKIAQWLTSVSPLKPQIPGKDEVSAGRCVAKRYTRSGNPTGCLSDFGSSWRIHGFYGENDYKDIINILLTPEDFEDIFMDDAIITIHKFDSYQVKVFVKE